MTKHSHVHPTGKAPEMRSQTENRFWEKVDIGTKDDCWEWTASLGAGGYGTFSFDGQVRRANRVAYRLTTGEIPDGKQVNHHCDNPACVNRNHLYLGTQSQNARDAYARDRRGDLDIEDVREIRRRYNDEEEDVTYKELAEEYGVTHAAIGDVVRRDSYDWVE